MSMNLMMESHGAMNKLKVILVTFLMSIAFFSLNTLGQTLGDDCLPPAIENKLVYDLGDILSDKEEIEIQNVLLSFKSSTSNTIVVVTHLDFCGYEPSVFAIEAGDKWGVGRGDLDNGIVIALKPRNGSESGKIFIAIGEGLEGAIPDILTGRIVDKMTPSFKEGMWFNGLALGINDLMSLASGEISESDYLAKSESQKTDGLAGMIILLFFFLFVPILSVGLNVRRVMNRNNLAFGLALAMVFSEMQRSRNSYNQFTHGTGHYRRGGGFGGGGFGGGGFGGFGGGGFGGGGAGGSF
ncbi:MAG: hypothetical protein COA49_01630 [Bacteroidetes bacterium]|nr:MAG: hypothetical protein COA49_01630 [Bacteroidota bacterium]